MAKLLFKLNGVPDDEAEDVRQLMQDNGIDIYETDAGRWLIGVAAIWLPDESRYDEARALIDAYEQRRYKLLHKESQSLTQGFINRLYSNPVESIIILLALIFIVGISVYPFMNFYLVK